jgi:hypothetical protein
VAATFRPKHRNCEGQAAIDNLPGLAAWVSLEAIRSEYSLADRWFACSAKENQDMDSLGSHLISPKLVYSYNGLIDRLRQL